MRSLQLAVLFALLATVARGDELLPITTHITSTLTGGFYSCGVGGGGFQNGALFGNSPGFAGGIDDAANSPCGAWVDQAIHVNAGLCCEVNFPHGGAFGPDLTVDWSYGNAHENISIGITGPGIPFHPNSLDQTYTFQERVKWVADVQVTASGNLYCDVTGGALFPLLGPCDFVALQDLYPPDQYPQLYTLYEWTASGHGNGMVTVQVRNGRVFSLDYSLAGVPEPSPLWLLATSAALAWLMSRRRPVA